MIEMLPNETNVGPTTSQPDDDDDREGQRDRGDGARQRVAERAAFDREGLGGGAVGHRAVLRAR